MLQRLGESMGFAVQLDGRVVFLAVIALIVASTLWGIGGDLQHWIERRRERRAEVSILERLYLEALEKNDHEAARQVELTAACRGVDVRKVARR